MSIKKVAIVGATGNVGQPILDALIASQQFEITAITRANSTATFPAGVRIAAVDYADATSLQEAVRGQDAVVSTLGYAAMAQQLAVLDAAVAAGVRRFLPSEFGGDTLNPLTAALPVYADKLAVHRAVEPLAARAAIEYTYLVTGPFLDWCMERAIFGVDLKARSAAFLDGGDTRFSTSSLAFVGRAVVGVLSHPDETRNRAVYVQEAAVSQHDLLRLSKVAVGASEGWMETDAGTTDALQKAGYERLARGEFDVPLVLAFLASSQYREDYGCRFQKLDNDLLGLRQKSEDELVELIKGLTS